MKCHFCAKDMPLRKNNFKWAYKFCNPACAGAYKHKIFSTPMNDLLCCECGQITNYESRKLYNLAKLRKRAYCGIKCKKKYVARIHAKTMKATNQKYKEQNLKRMKEQNPMFCPETLEKMRDKLRGRTFLSRGGNGNPTKPQIILHQLSGLPIEYSISLKGLDKKFKSPPTCYKVDLADPNSKLAIEIDGQSHTTKKWKFLDKRKTEILNHLGWRVIRFKNKDVLDNPNACWEKIKETSKHLMFLQ